MTAVRPGRLDSERLAHDLAEAFADPPRGRGFGDHRWSHQSLSKGAAGVAVMHNVLARSGTVGPGRADAWLARAASEQLTAGDRSGLWFGAPAVAFAAEVCDPLRYRSALTDLDLAVTTLIRDRLAAAAARMDAARRPGMAEFDLVRGLTGLGAYLLARDRGSVLLRGVLDYLVRLTEPVPVGDDAGTAVPGWWVDGAPSVRSPIRAHGNLGIAHGISGPLALLALAMRAGVTVTGHATAMQRIEQWLDSWRQPSPAGPWWPKYVTLAEVAAGRPAQDSAGRPSWCYGTPGLARAQQLAAIARRDRQRQADAEDALARCLADPAQLAQLTDPYLCHGWAGLAVTTWYAAADASTTSLTEQLPRIATALAEHTLRRDGPHPPGLIDGAAGAALALYTIACDSRASRWPACLLIA